MMKKPNILILHADQHRADCLGAYGNPDVKTPHIDSLAADGVLYRSHYTVYPVCTPSRYSLLCGLYPHQHLAYSNESTLPPGIPTFPALLRKAGYKTAAVGKMHMTPTYQDVGYDRMTLSEQNGFGRYEDDYHTFLLEHGALDRIDLRDQVDSIRKTGSPAYYESFGGETSDLPEPLHSTRFITDNALKELESWDAAGGSLLFVGYIKPHHPFDPPKPYDTLYDPEKITLLPGYTPYVPAADWERGHGFFDNSTLSEETLRKVTALYYGTISQIDDGVGEILSFLKEKGLYDDTLILYTSDHGEYLGFHHMLLKSNHLYDPLTRLPLIVKYPREMGRKGEEEGLSSNLDIAPTLLSLCGLPVPGAMGGIDLSVPGAGHPAVFGEGQFGSDAAPDWEYMARDKRYKLLLKGSLENRALFDLERDPFELTDCSGDPAYKEPLERLTAAAVNELLFKSPTVLYRDDSAPVTLDRETTNTRARAVRGRIREEFPTFK